MVEQRSHFTTASIVSLSYAAVGSFAYNMAPEEVLLAGVVVLIAGVLPDIDSRNGAPAKEMIGLLSVVGPLLAIEFFPWAHEGGISRTALVVIGAYALTRFLVTAFLEHCTTQRGIVHSIPAAIITFELVYLSLGDLILFDRIFIALGAFIGYLAHLLMDAYGNMDLWGRTAGKPRASTPVLKFGGNKVGTTIAAYACMFVLGYFIAQDFYPSLQVTSPVQY